MPRAKMAAKPKTAPSKKTVKAQPQKTAKKAISKPKKVTFSPNLKCSFCGKSSKTARRLIALEAPSKISICDECIELCIMQLLVESPHEWATRITRIFAICAEKLKEKSKQDKVKPKSKSRIK